MKNGKNRFLACLCSFLCCCFVLCMVMAASPVFASDVTAEATESSTDPTEPSTSEHIVSEEVVRSVSPVTPSDANGFKAVLLGLFGNYETVVTEHRYTSSNGYTSVQVTTEPDYAWMIAAAIFTVVIYCLLRLLGGVLCGRK